jgi:glycosyltransferase involved in cell wall biosynthesis
MLGSTGHLTTRDSFAWFVANARSHRLPQVRIVVGGGKTDDLLPRGTTVEGLELRGWLEQGVLDDLLARAQAVLLPQLLGFGSPTRIAEMACAGVPVLVSRQATFSLDLPPGVDIVEDSWDAWSGKIVEVSGRSGLAASTYEEYLAWERAQPRTLEMIVQSHLVPSAL